MCYVCVCEINEAHYYCKVAVSHFLISLAQYNPSVPYSYNGSIINNGFYNIDPNESFS